MTRATGGSAFAATSTRSRLRAYAYSSASFVSVIPICSPSSPTSLTRGTRICSLIRSCWTTGRVLSSGRRRGLKRSSPSRVDPPHSWKRHCMQRRHSLVGTDSVEPRTALGRRGEGRCRSCLQEMSVAALRAIARLFGGALLGDLVDELLEREGRDPLPAALPDGHRLACLAVAPDDD